MGVVIFEVKIVTFMSEDKNFKFLVWNFFLLAKYLLHTIKINGTYLLMRSNFLGTSHFILSLTLVPLHFHHSILCVPSLCTPGAAVWVGPCGHGDRSFPHLNLKMDQKNSLKNNYIKSWFFMCPINLKKNSTTPAVW